MKKEEKKIYVKVGDMALRSPDGKLLPAQPIYIEVPEEETKATEQLINERTAAFFYQLMKSEEN